MLCLQIQSHWGLRLQHTDLAVEGGGHNSVHNKSHLGAMRSGLRIAWYNFRMKPTLRKKNREDKKKLGAIVKQLGYVSLEASPTSGFLQLLNKYILSIVLTNLSFLLSATKRNLTEQLIDFLDHLVVWGTICGFM